MFLLFLDINDSFLYLIILGILLLAFNSKEPLIKSGENDFTTSTTYFEHEEVYSMFQQSQ